MPPSRPASARRKREDDTDAVRKPADDATPTSPPAVPTIGDADQSADLKPKPPQRPKLQNDGIDTAAPKAEEVELRQRLDADAQLAARTAGSLTLNSDDGILSTLPQGVTDVASPQPSTGTAVTQSPTRTVAMAAPLTWLMDASQSVTTLSSSGSGRPLTQLLVDTATARGFRGQDPVAASDFLSRVDPGFLSQDATDALLVDIATQRFPACLQKDAKNELMKWIWRLTHLLTKATQDSAPAAKLDAAERFATELQDTVAALKDDKGALAGEIDRLTAAQTTLTATHDVAVRRLAAAEQAAALSAALEDERFSTLHAETDQDVPAPDRAGPFIATAVRLVVSLLEHERQNRKRSDEAFENHRDAAAKDGQAKVDAAETAYRIARQRDAADHQRALQNAQGQAKDAVAAALRDRDAAETRCAAAEDRAVRAESRAAVAEARAAAAETTGRVAGPQGSGSPGDVSRQVALEAEVAALKCREAADRQRLDLLGRQLAEAERSAAARPALEDQLRATTAQAAALRADLITAQSAVAVHAAELGNMRNRHHQLSVALEAARRPPHATFPSAHADDAAADQRRTDALRRDVSMARAEAATARTALDRVTGDRDRLADTSAEAQRNLDAAREEARGLRARLASAEAAASDLRQNPQSPDDECPAKLARALHRVAALETQLKQAKAAEMAARDDCDDLTSQLDAAQSVATKLRAYPARLDRANESAKASLDEAEARLARAEERCDQLESAASAARRTQPTGAGDAQLREALDAAEARAAAAETRVAHLDADLMEAKAATAAYQRQDAATRAAPARERGADPTFASRRAAFFAAETEDGHARGRTDASVDDSGDENAGARPVNRPTFPASRKATAVHSFSPHRLGALHELTTVVTNALGQSLSWDRLRSRRQVSRLLSAVALAKTAAPKAFHALLNTWEALHTKCVSNKSNVTPEVLALAAQGYGNPDLPMDTNTYLRALAPIFHGLIVLEAVATGEIGATSDLRSEIMWAAAAALSVRSRTLSVEVTGNAAKAEAVATDEIVLGAVKAVVELRGGFKPNKSDALHACVDHVNAAAADGLSEALLAAIACPPI